MDSFVKFEPLYKPGHTVQIAGESYKVKEVRPAFPFTYKATNIASDTTVDLKDAGLKGATGELLHVRVRVLGPCQFTFRVEGAGGPVVGGWGGREVMMDEGTEFEAFIFEDRYGWLFVKAVPLITPAWFQVRAEGWVYLLEKTTEKPVSYPPYISEER